MIIKIVVFVLWLMVFAFPNRFQVILNYEKIAINRLNNIAIRSIGFRTHQQLGKRLHSQPFFVPLCEGFQLLFTANYILSHTGNSIATKMSVLKALYILRSEATGKCFFAYGFERGACSSKILTGELTDPAVSKVCNAETGEMLMMLHQRGEGGALHLGTL